MYKIARYRSLLAFQEIYHYAIQHLSAMSAKGGFTGFSDNKCPLKMQSKEIENQYNQGEPQMKQHGHSWAIKRRVESILECQTNDSRNFVYNY